MPIYDIYSKRLRKMKGDVPEVYVYDDLPKPLRVQIVQIWTECLGKPNRFTMAGQHIDECYKNIVKILQREYGVNKLPLGRHVYDFSYDELREFFYETTEVDKALDVVELVCQLIDEQPIFSHLLLPPIDELNQRFKEHGVGYRFESGQMIRIDEEFIHEEVVKSALRILSQPQFAGAQEEFLKAHEQYRKGETKDSLSNCLKAFESVMKAICDMRGWQYDKDRSTAQALIKICFDNGVVPKFWDSHYSSLRSLLESGVPTGRNKLGGHGQGTAPTSVPNYLAAYMLHMTATTIAFLAEAEKELQKFG